MREASFTTTIRASRSTKARRIGGSGELNSTVGGVWVEVDMVNEGVLEVRVVGVSRSRRGKNTEISTGVVCMSWFGLIATK